MKKQKLTAVLCICLCLITGCSENGYSETNLKDEYIPEFYIPKEEPVEKPSAVDDFYGYVNFDTLSDMEIEFERNNAGTVPDRDAETIKEIKEIIKGITESNTDFPAGSAEANIKKLFNQYINFKGADAETVKVFENVHQMLENAETIDEFMAVCAELLKKYGVKTFVVPQTDMDPFNPSVNGVTICGMDSFAGMKISYVTETAGMAGVLRMVSASFADCTGAQEDSEQRGDDMAIAILAVANATDKDAADMRLRASKAESRTAEEMEKIFSSFSFRDYIKLFSGVYPDRYCIYDQKQLEEINSLLIPDNLRALKDIAYSEFIAEYRNTVPDEFIPFASYIGTDQRYDVKSAYDFIMSTLESSVDRLYAEKYTDEASISSATVLCEKIREAYRKTINASPWLSKEARDKMTKKLDNIVFLVGIPDNTSVNQTGQNLFETLVNYNISNLNTDLSVCGKKYDCSKFKLSAATVNACYSHDNTVTVPAAFLAAPFFSADDDDTDNISRMGFIIAHEISHAFDSDGICYDYEHRYNPDWIPEKDILMFDELKNKTEEYFSKQTIMDVHHINGKQTLGENLADIGAVECILSFAENDAAKKRMLENYASLFCTLETEHNALSNLEYDTHSPYVTRVNAVVSSCDDFYRIYGVKDTDGMYISPDDRIGRWLR